jgi:hypothetical protein
MGRKDGDLFARVPPEWIPELDRRAAAEGLNRSILVRRAVRALLSATGPTEPALSTEEERIVDLWRILREDAPEVADSVLRLAAAAVDRLRGMPAARRSAGPPGGAAETSHQGNGR